MHATPGLAAQAAALELSTGGGGAVTGDAVMVGDATGTTGEAETTEGVGVTTGGGVGVGVVGA